MSKFKEIFWVKDTAVWLVLFGLTILSYLQFEAKGGAAAGGELIFPIAAIKFMLVFWFFMKMRNSHILWKILAAVYIGAVYILYLVL